MRKVVLFTASMMLIFIGLKAQTISTETFSDANTNLPDIGSNFNVPINTSSIDGDQTFAINVYLEYDTEVLNFTGNFYNNQYGVFFSDGDGEGLDTLKIEVADLGTLMSDLNDGLLLELEFTYLGGDSPLNFIVSGDPRTNTEGFYGTYYFDAADVTNGSVNGGNPTNTITSGTWSEATDWSTGVVPNSFHNVVVGSGLSEVTLNSDEVANSVTIEDGGQLTQDATTTLEVTGDFVIQSGGSFIQNGTVNAANKNAQRDVPAYTVNEDGWHLLSSPVASQAIDNTAFEPVDGSDDFFMWDESVAVEPWINHDGGSFTSFGIGTGYLVAYSSAKTLEFTGDFNTATVTGLNVANTTSNDWAGFTLLGNPYPSAIEWGTGWDLGGLQTSAYVWNESNKAYTTISEGDPIPAMNGFMVYLPTSGSETLDIPAAARVHNAQDWYKTEEEKIVLVAHDPSNESAQQHTIKFNTEATAEYDRKHDAVFMSGYAPQFYSNAGGKSLMVNTLPSHSYETAIPLTFKKNEGEQYVIELVENTTGQEVFLRDLKANKTISLTDRELYEFTAEAGDIVERFELKFSTVGVEENELNAAKVYSTENILVIENLNTQAEVQVFNLNGQLMHRFDTAGSSRIEERLNVESGIYMVQIRSGKAINNTKVFIK